MGSYLIRRLILIVPTLVITSLIIFIIIRLIPGNVIDLMTSQLPLSTAFGGTNSTEEIKAHLRQELGLDVPFLEQYARWIGDIVRGDLGESLWNQASVIGMILPRIPVTLELTLFSFLVAVIVSMPIGILSAIRQDSIGDYIGRSIAIIAMSVPVFWTGISVMLFPSIWWHWSPPISLVPFSENPAKHLATFIVPSIVLGLSFAGINMRLIRTMMLDVLRNDYIRTAWAKGIKEREIVTRHVLKNAMIPVVTVWGLQIQALIGGALIIELIFSLPGIGRLTLTSTMNRDYPVIIGIMLVISIFVLLINLLVDLSYAWLDPRIHH